MSDHPITEVSAHSQGPDSPVVDSPLTCRYCRKAPATQAFVADIPHIGMDTALVCAPCGDWSDGPARQHATVWRFTLTPIRLSLNEASS